MRFAIQGHVAMMDNETKEKIAAARERLFGRLRNHIAELDVRVDHSAQTGATLCQVNVRSSAGPGWIKRGLPVEPCARC